MAAALPTVKRGNTFFYYLQWDEANIAELRSQVRTSSGELLSEVVIEQVEGGIFKLSVTDTTNWPVGQAVYTDIRRTYTGGNVSSETMSIRVEKEVTV